MPGSKKEEVGFFDPRTKTFFKVESREDFMKVIIALER